jgi:hypothetical protein
LAIALLFVWTQRISDAPVVKDAAQIVRMGINLERHGVISMDEQAPYHPSDYREPLPVLSAALAAKIVDILHGPAEPREYLSGQRVRDLKYQNIVWMALLSGGAFFAVRVLGGSFAFALVGVVLVNLRFLGTRGGGADIDDLLTELPAAAVLMWASLVLALAFTRRKLAWFALAGLLLGIMALIKAAILYVFVGIVGVWLAVNLWRRSAAGMLAVGREVLILGVAFSCIVAPWMCRNLLEIGSFEISQRAGVVLMYRALHNLMTPGEYFGSFYAWAPPRLQPTVGKMLGFTPADLQRNGRLQRLNDDLHSDFAADDLAAELAGRPDLAISFYWQARAQREQAEGLLAAQGRTEAESAVEADALLKRRALSIFREHPGRALATTIPFMWRGSPRTFPILVIALGLALRYRRYELATFALPALGIVLEYALFTHFIQRYDEPANAVAIVASLGLVTMLWAGYRARRSVPGVGVRASAPQ